MAYTILVRDARRFRFDDVGLRLVLAGESSSFVFDVEDGGPSRSGHRVVLRRVRLREARPYCGQHPGPCATGRARRRSRCLDWSDWIAFNRMVNDALDDAGCDAEVYSLPPDVSGKFWIRRGNRSRVRYDWTEEVGPGGRVRRVWNRGTPDQFAVAE